MNKIAIFFYSLFKPIYSSRENLNLIPKIYSEIIQNTLAERNWQKRTQLYGGGRISALSEILWYEFQKKTVSESRVFYRGSTKEILTNAMQVLTWKSMLTADQSQ